MPPSVHALLGYSSPAVKNGQVRLGLLIGSEQVFIECAPEMIAQLAADTAAAVSKHNRSYGHRRKQSDAARAAQGLPITKPGGGL